MDPNQFPAQWVAEFYSAFKAAVAWSWPLISI